MGSSGKRGQGGSLIPTTNKERLNQRPITGTLTEWERYTRQGADSNNEQIAFFTKEGEPITGFVGGRHSVAFNPRYANIEGAIATHNHPDNDFGGTLSMQDLRVFANTQLGELRAFSEQGQLYSIKAGENVDRKGLKKWLNTNQRLMQKNFEKSYDSAYKQATTPLKSGEHAGKVKLVNRRTGKVVYRDPMTPAQATRYARQYSVGAFERTYKKNLARFGVTYTSTKAGSGR